MDLHKKVKTTTSWLNDVFENSPDMIVVLDQAGLIRNVNGAFRSFCGRSGSKCTGIPISNFVAAPHRTQWQHDLNQLISGKWTNLDSVLVNQKGRKMPCHISLMAKSTEHAKSITILHLQDTSIYHTVERAMVMAQVQWERSFDSIPDYMCLLDRSGHVIRANSAMVNHFKPLYPNLTGIDYRALFGLAGAPKAKTAIPDAVQASPFVIPKIELSDPKGWFSISSFPIKDDKGIVTGAVFITRNITEQHAVTEALRKATQHQHQTTKMEAIGRLAGGIAHDFNNMLTAILGYSSLLLKTTDPNDPRVKDIKEIIASAERSTALTRQLLDFSRNQPLETSRVNLNNVIRSMQNFINHALGEKIKLRMTLAPNLGDIKADVSRLEQVIVNLVVNAGDAMPGGGQLMIETANRTINQDSYSTHPELEPGNYVELEVSDTGCGIPPETLEHIFEPFFTTKPKGKGTGLGLTTTYGIVKQFGGHISVYSEIGRGTTFRMHFPAIPVKKKSIEPAKKANSLLSGKETVMVIDDDVNIVNMVNQILTAMGYQVICASSSHNALIISNEYAGKIDLVLADIVMPELNGPELARLMRHKRPDLRILFMSGYASEAAAQIGELNPDMVLIQKPFSPETLSQQIRKVLDNCR